MVGIVALLVLMQFVQTDKSAPYIIEKEQFKQQFEPTEDMLATLQSACYDYHSYETKNKLENFFNLGGNVELSTSN